MGKRKVEQDASSKQPEQKVNSSKNTEKTEVDPNDITEQPKEEGEITSFTYEENGKTLNFEFVSDKRVKCPKCRNDFKNILRHLQQSSCKINNIEDLSMSFKKFKIMFTKIWMRTF